ncbi:MAG: integration host factor subunit beta [Holophagaceae bacterium]|nr:integration host factor subunit beta [Holophagaceae bacterium]
MEHVGTLTKADLSRHLMDKLEITKKDADLLVNTFLKSIISSLRSGQGVELRGFGSFRLRDRKPRMGRNPRNGQSIHVPSKRVVYFKLGKELRAKLVDEVAGGGL